MLSSVVEVKNRVGLHAGAATALVQTANEFDCAVFLELDGSRANAKSLMGVLALGVRLGAQIKVETSGEDEEQALAELTELIESGMNQTE